MTTAALTVVVPSVNGWADLAGCLAALDGERQVAALEVLVPERCGEAVRQQIAATYPWAIILPVARTATIPEMRAEAFDRATAPSVAVIEDHVLVPQGWARELLSARESERVIGGTVRNAATATTVDWAAFLCEYSHLLPPLAAGPAEWLTGNNTVYDRELLDRYRAVTHAGRWEDHLHEALRRDGITLMCCPAIVVDHKKHYSAGEYFAQRFLYSRSYAGTRVAGRHVASRIAHGVAAFALPPVLLWRTLSRARRGALPGGIVLRCVPLLAVFVCAWGAGEVAGYWFGAGDSLRKVC